MEYTHSLDPETGQTVASADFVGDTTPSPQDAEAARKAAQMEDMWAAHEERQG